MLTGYLIIASVVGLRKRTIEKVTANDKTVITHKTQLEDFLQFIGTTHSPISKEMQKRCQTPK